MKQLNFFLVSSQQTDTTLVGQFSDFDKQSTQISLEFSDNLIRCNLPNRRTLIVKIGSRGIVEGSIDFAIEIQDKRCKNSCFQKYISEIEIQTTNSFYKYGDAAIRVVKLSI